MVVVAFCSVRIKGADGTRARVLLHQLNGGNGVDRKITVVVSYKAGESSGNLGLNFGRVLIAQRSFGLVLAQACRVLMHKLSPDKMGGC